MVARADYATPAVRQVRFKTCEFRLSWLDSRTVRVLALKLYGEVRVVAHMDEHPVVKDQTGQRLNCIPGRNRPHGNNCDEQDYPHGDKDRQQSTPSHSDSVPMHSGRTTSKIPSSSSHALRLDIEIAINPADLIRQLTTQARKSRVAVFRRQFSRNSIRVPVAFGA
jgi:hypothetical protein